MSNFIIDELMHYGTKRHSGRFPYGSGENPYQHESWYKFLSEVDEKRNGDFEFTDEKGRTYTGDLAIAKSMGLTSTEFRTKLSISNTTARSKEVEYAKKLRADGWSLQSIAENMGYDNESSIRSLLNQNTEARMLSAQKTADFLKQQVDEKGMIDVGVGVERELGVSREKLNQALYILEMEGYPIYKGGIPQVTNPGQQTNQKVLCVPGTQHKEIYDYANVHSATDDFFSPDGGETFQPRFIYPESLNSKRIDVIYGDEGAKKEGLIELRRGVPDIDLGEGTHYAQVRIMVDGTHYVKGMAVYSDDLPDGVDVRINTKKSSDTPLKGGKDNSVLKPIKNDPDNPFGSLIKEGINDPEHGTKGGGQSYYIDADGKKKLSVINKRAEEGDWREWSDTLPSQFLAKQSLSLINRQLNLAKNDKQSEYDEIMSLNNPAVKKQRLKAFAEDCDAAAEHLKAAALPRQKYQVMLPLTTIKDEEIYAPNYDDGETVALIRYPHGGTFEIPILKVNNHNKEGQKAMGKLPQDAVGISKAVADRLSGADFDGDTVMVVPCNSRKSSIHIISTKSLTDGFDDILEYGGKPEGSFKKMKNTQTEMGIVSNLIMDMTLKGASEEELARAVKHSMVIIDAEKHNLDYKQSEKDFGIKELKKKYQGRVDADGKYHEGASTLITRAKSEVQVLKRQGSPIIDPDTGKVSYKTKTETYTDPKTGKEKVRTQKSTQMRETDDAFTLSTGTLQENAYAEYANYMKSMANSARKEMLATKDMKYSPEAKAAYKQEVDSLNNKLDVALKNAPRERRAQAMANSIVATKKQENPDMTKAEKKKIAQKALTESRAKVGAKRTTFTVTDKEWEAMQSGAVSANILSQLVSHMDQDQLMELSTPRQNREISGAKQAKISAMAASGFTASEIASVVGVSTTTVHKYLNE